MQIFLLGYETMKTGSLALGPMDFQVYWDLLGEYVPRGKQSRETHESGSQDVFE
jgi:hypothetical protein